MTHTVRRNITRFVKTVQTASSPPPSVQSVPSNATSTKDIENKVLSASLTPTMFATLSQQQELLQLELQAHHSRLNIMISTIVAVSTSLLVLVLALAGARWAIDSGTRYPDSLYYGLSCMLAALVLSAITTSFYLMLHTSYRLAAFVRLPMRFCAPTQAEHTSNRAIPPSPPPSPPSSSMPSSPARSKERERALEYGYDLEAALIASSQYDPINDPCSEKAH